MAERQFHLTAIKLSLQQTVKTKWAYLPEIKLLLQQIVKKKDSTSLRSELHLPTIKLSLQQT